MQTVSLITISATFFLVLFTKAAKSQNDFRFADSISTWNILEKYTSLTSQVISYKTLVFFTSKDTFISSKNYQIIKNVTYVSIAHIKYLFTIFKGNIYYIILM
jgi:hypothetical protein